MPSTFQKVDLEANLLTASALRLLLAAFPEKGIRSETLWTTVNDTITKLTGASSRLKATKLTSAEAAANLAFNMSLLQDAGTASRAIIDAYAAVVADDSTRLSDRHAFEVADAACNRALEPFMNTCDTGLKKWATQVFRVVRWGVKAKLAAKAKAEAAAEAEAAAMAAADAKAAADAAAEVAAAATTAAEAKAAEEEKAAANAAAEAAAKAAAKAAAEAEAAGPVSRLADRPCDTFANIASDAGEHKETVNKISKIYNAIVHYRLRCTMEENTLRDFHGLCQDDFAKLHALTDRKADLDDMMTSLPEKTAKRVDLLSRCSLEQFEFSCTWLEAKFQNPSSIIVKTGNKGLLIDGTYAPVANPKDHLTLKTLDVLRAWKKVTPKRDTFDASDTALADDELTVVRDALAARRLALINTYYVLSVTAKRDRDPKAKLRVCKWLLGYKPAYGNTFTVLYYNNDKAPFSPYEEPGMASWQRIDQPITPFLGTKREEIALLKELIAGKVIVKLTPPPKKKEEEEEKGKEKKKEKSWIGLSIAVKPHTDVFQLVQPGFGKYICLVTKVAGNGQAADSKKIKAGMIISAVNDRDITRVPSTKAVRELIEAATQGGTACTITFRTRFGPATQAALEMRLAAWADKVASTADITWLRGLPAPEDPDDDDDGRLVYQHSLTTTDIGRVITGTATVTINHRDTADFDDCVMYVHVPIRKTGGFAGVFEPVKHELGWDLTKGVAVWFMGLREVLKAESKSPHVFLVRIDRQLFSEETADAEVQTIAARLFQHETAVSLSSYVAGASLTPAEWNSWYVIGFDHKNPKQCERVDTTFLYMVQTYEQWVDPGYTYRGVQFDYCMTEHESENERWSGGQLSLTPKPKTTPPEAPQGMVGWFNTVASALTAFQIK